MSNTEVVEAESFQELFDKVSTKTTNKPLLLYITGFSKKVQKTQKFIEASTFKDERIGIGAKFFKLIKVPEESLTLKGVLAKKVGGKKLPRIVVISRDGKYVKKLEGRISASKLFSAMNRIVKKDMGRNLSKFHKSMSKILNQMEGVAKDRKQIAAKRASFLKKGKKGKLKGLEKEDAALDVRQKKIDKDLADLMELTKPKPPKNGVAKAR